MTGFAFSLHLYNIVPKSFTLIYIPAVESLINRNQKLPISV